MTPELNTLVGTEAEYVLSSQGYESFFSADSPQWP